MSMSMSLGRKDQRESVLHCDVEETDSGNTGYDVDIDIEGEEKSLLPARMCPSCQQHLPSSCPARTRDLRNREGK